MEYLIRFIQIHETFRQPEINALAELNGFKIRWVLYSDDSPFGIISFEDIDRSNEAAKALISRSVLTHAIYELWGQGIDYDFLHRDVRSRTSQLWEQYRLSSFCFAVQSYRGRRTEAEKSDIIDAFGYMGLEGPIVLSTPEHKFAVFEAFEMNEEKPTGLYLGKFVGESGRKAIHKYSLKKRKYIATTSMDAELSLVTANIALAAPAKITYDPFMGTGSFPVACAHFGSTVFGSDLDGRSIRGKNGIDVTTNFRQYGSTHLYLDGFIADLTNSPLRKVRFLDSIVCDPPYGVREGLKVLGSVKPALQQEVLLADGTPAHLGPRYLPPKKPYSFIRMLDDVLEFGSEVLVDHGRVCMWMPVAGILEAPADFGLEIAPDLCPNREGEYKTPQHPALELVSVCTQEFNKWSRRLLTYRRRTDQETDQVELTTHRARRLELQAGPANMIHSTANELNAFRRKYFQGFSDPTP